MEMLVMSLNIKLNEAKKNANKVKITTIGDHEYTGIITYRTPKNVTIKKDDGSKNTLWTSSITGLEIFEKSLT